MLLQVPRRLKGLVAHVLGTLVRLLPRVCAQVALQAVARGKGLAAGQDLTAVRSVPRVRSLVHLHKMQTQKLSIRFPCGLRDARLCEERELHAKEHFCEAVISVRVCVYTASV